MAKILAKTLVFFALCLPLAAFAQTSWVSSATVTAVNNTTYSLGSTVVSRTMDVPDSVTVTITTPTGTTLNNSSNTITFNLQGSNSKVNWDARIEGSSGNGVIKVTGNGEFTVRSGSSVTGSGSYAIYSTGSNSMVRVQGGTVTGSGSYTIYNEGNVAISSGTVSGTGSSYAISAYYGDVTVSGGTVKTDNGISIYGAFRGTLTVNGGTVEATGDNSGARAIYGFSNINISGSAQVRVNNGTAIYDANIVTINGGTVSATSTTANNVRAIYYCNNVEITSGTVSTVSSGTDTRTIETSGNVTISGGTVSTNNGVAIRNTGWNSTITVSNGTIRATGNSTDARAIQTTGTSNTLSIIGGTVSMTNASPSGLAIEAAGDVKFGNSPTITGKIRTGYNKLSVNTIAPVFSPGSRTYTLDPATYSLGQIAVAGGASFISNFRLDNTQYALRSDGTNLLVNQGIATAAITVQSGNSPILGATASSTASISGGSSFTVGSVTWTPTPTNGQFQPGTAYTASVTLSANTGYSFNLTTRTINGQTATVSNNTGNTVTLSYTFPATARYTGSGSISINNWTFGTTPSTPVPSTSVTEYAAPAIHYSVRETNNWSTQAPTNAGNYTVRATWAQTASYYEYVATHDFAIEKATRDFPPPFEEDINLTYAPTLTLGNITLPSGYEWVDASTTSLNAEEEQVFELIYTDPSGNYEAVTGEVTVNVVLPGSAEIPTIVTQPVGGTVSVGAAFTATVAAAVDDGGTLSYQWYSNTFASNMGGTIIQGAIGTSYFQNTKKVGTFYYYVVITNTNNNATTNNTTTIASEVITLNVIPAQTPNIAMQPESNIVSAGASHALSVSASIGDGGTLLYQWYSNTSESNENGMAIEGATSASYNPSTATVGEFYYYVVVTNRNSNFTDQTATVTSEVVTLNVIQAEIPNIAVQPVGGTVSINASRILSVSANISDGGTLLYQWYSNTSESNEDGMAIEGATSASYSPNTAVVGTFYYYVVVTNRNNNAIGNTAEVVSNVVTIDVVIPANAATPNITTQPVGNTVTIGNAYALTVSASVSSSDGGTLTYQWYRTTSANNWNGTAINGATMASYIPSSATIGTFYYYVVVTNTNNNASANKTAMQTSNIATLVVNGGTRSITVRGWDSNSDTWNNATLRIVVNGNHSRTLTFTSTTNSGTWGPYTYNVGDLVEIYWDKGTKDNECAFTINYTDAAPSPFFDPTAGTSNNSDANLVFRRYNTLGSVSAGTLLGSFTVTAPTTTYNLTINKNPAESGTVSVNGPVVAQTVFSEDFEGATHSFTIVNGTQTNQWYVGTAVRQSGTKSAYISNNNGTSNAFTNTTASTVHMYRNISLPASTQPYTLTFDWRAEGESSYDYLQVFLVPTSTTPAAGTQLTTNQIGNTHYNLGGATTWNNASISIPAYANATTMRLVFSWRNDGSSGTQPPVAIDNVKLVAPMSGTTVTLTSANTSYNAGASVTVTATPASGYAFTNWSGASTSTNATINVHMSSAKTLTANFVPTYTLAVNKNPVEGGTVKVNGVATQTIFSENFEGSNSFAIVNGTQTNQWHIGTAVNNGGTKSAYISNDNGVSNAYTLTSASTVHMYKDINFPASSQPYTLNFDWKAQGQSSNDYLRVFLVPTTTTPVAGTQLSTAYLIGDNYYQMGGATVWNNASISIPAYATATTRRLVFSWYNNASSGTQPPVALDNIALVTTTAHNSGTEATIAATPEPGYVFLGWSGASTSTDASITLAMNSNQTLTAKFQVENAEIPIISTQPTGGTVLAGATINPLTVSATVSDGGTLSYQWYRNGAVIEGATNASYTPPTDEIGNYSYYAVVTNTNSNTYNLIATATSDVAEVIVTLQAPAVPREITIAMRDISSDGWDGNGALMISVNGEYISPNPTLVESGNGTTVFTANVGDEIKVYWSGSHNYNTENAFAIYYTDTPPNTTFNPTAGAANDNNAILVSRQYGDLTSSSNGTLLGEFVVTPSSATVTYTLTVNSIPVSGGSIAANGFAIDETATFYDGTLITLVAMPATGYNFTGWSGASTSTEAKIMVAMDQNQELTANFALKIYSVTFVDWNGTTVLKTEYVEHGSSATAPANPTRTGYTFDDWDVEFSEVTGNLIVTATYAINTYEVTLPVCVGYTISAQSESSSPVDYNGSYSFTVLLDDGYSNSIIVVKANEIVLMADEGGVYTISNIMEDQNITIEDVVLNVYAITLPTNTIGYTVSAQSESSSPVDYNGSYSFTVLLDDGYSNSIIVVKANEIVLMADEGGVYTINNIIEPQDVTVEDVVLNTYMVTFNANNGTSTPSVQTKTYGIDLELSSTEPTRTGYTFTGWNTSSDGSGTAYVAGATYTANVALTLYAQWAIDTYPITYNANGGTGEPSAQTKTYGIDLELSSTEPTRIGYTFNGWNTEEDGSGTNYGARTYYSANAALTLYAKWTLNTYSISYTLNSGIVSPTNPTSYNIETPTFTLNNPTRAGYTFTGWTGANGTTLQESVTIEQGSTGSKTYTANWTVITYTITYHLDGGTNSTSNPATYTVASSTVLYNPTKTGYTFAGWYSNEELAGTSVSSIPSGSTGGKEYWAKWTINTYVVTFTGTYGTGFPTAQTKTYGVDLELSSTEPTRTGYTFTGWNTSSSGNGTAYAAGANYIANAAVTLYAQWTINTYPITYNANGGSGAPSAQTKTYGNSLYLSSTTPTRTGYTFNGWNTEEDGSGTNYSAGAYYSVNAALALYARWTPISYSISYTLNGGTVSPANPTSYNIETPTFTLNNPARAGYTFTGWTGANGTTPETSVAIEQGSTGNKTYTANWSVITYSITYHLDGGTNNASNLATYTVTGSRTLYNPTKEGYTFAGWYNNEELAGTSVSSIPSGSTGNKEYWAKWTINTYNVTYNANGGTGIPSAQTKTYGIDLELSSTEPTRTGYTFAGWNTSSNGSGTAYAAGANYTANATVTLYAQWTIDTYSITYNANGGTDAPSAQIKTYGSSLYLSNATPTRIGYTFNSWNTEEDGSGTTYYAGTYYYTNAALMLYAQWTISTYTVTFVDYYGIGAPSAQTKTYDIDLELSSTEPTRTGYTFAGWNTSSSGNGMDYAAGANYTINAALTLYAQWTPNTYTVTFVDHDGTELKTEYVSYGSSATAPIDPIREGYTFNGWDIWFGNVTSDLTVTATYMFNSIPNTYTVTFVDWNGSLLKTEKVKQGSAATAPIAPARTGYTFIGWDVAFGSVMSNLTVTANYISNGTPIAKTLLAASSIRAYTSGGSIVLENLPQNAKVQIYTLSGKQIYSANPKNSKILKIEVQTKRVYLVKVNGKTFKVAR